MAHVALWLWLKHKVRPLPARASLVLSAGPGLSSPNPLLGRGLARIVRAMGNICCGGVGAAGGAAAAYTHEDGEQKPAEAPVLIAATSSQESYPAKKEVLARGVKRLSDQSEERAKELFRQYRHRASTCSPEIFGGPAQWPTTPVASTAVRRQSSYSDGDGRRNRMREKDLRSLLHDVDPELFQFVWTLFDSGDGVVYADDFVAAMALLATSADVNAGIEEQLQACFVMFDTRGDGRLG